VESPENSQQQNSGPLADPFAQIFSDRAEADWAFDLLRDATRRLRATGPYDPRLAVTLSTRGGRPILHLDFGAWLVLGFRGPGQTPARVDMALLAGLVTWDERFSTLPSDRKESEPEVRSYELPLELVYPLTSHLQQTFETTLDFIADKFAAWKRSPHWKQHNPELVEAFFDPDKRAHLFTAGLPEPELRYEPNYTAFELELAEEGEGYEVGEIGDWRLEIGDEEIREETMEQLATQQRLAEPFSKIFVDREEAEWAFNFLQKTFKQFGIKTPDDPRFAIVLARRYGGLNLHFDFGSWLVVGFREPGLRPQRVRLPFITNQVEFEEDFIEYSFKQSSDEPDIAGYGLPIEIVRNLDDELYAIYESALDSIAARFQNQQQCPWLRYHQLAIAEAILDLEKRHLLFENGLVAQPIEDVIGDENLQSPISNLPIPQSPISNLQSPHPPYPLSQLIADTGYDEETLRRWVRAIERKGQAIFYGPPGTGKTFIAEKLATHLVGGGDGFVELVQFHPAYAYEDFIQGLRPTARREGGLDYELIPGRFLEFCRQAQSRRDTCVLIIDEINRADLSRVFGELMYLLEYRDRDIPLAGGGRLKIPANARLIGAMNTADRSIALVDHALRRRFAFLALRPNFDVLRRYHQREQSGFAVEGLIHVVSRLNRRIEEDYQVGVTFFMAKALAEHIEDIWRLEIEPYLEEYFFDRRDEIDEFRWARVKQEILSA
jgi:5-methylcytosine-specific restriction protein B